MDLGTAAAAGMTAILTTTTSAPPQLQQQQQPQPPAIHAPVQSVPVQSAPVQDGHIPQLRADEYWDHRSLEQARVYCTMAQLSAAMNEKASFQFNKWHNWSIVIISVLTVITGSQSIPEITNAGSAAKSRATQIVTVFVAACSICLGALASIVARMDWRGRAVAYGKRSVGYGRLAGDIRLELTLPARERRPARLFFETIMAKVAELEELGDPLPPQYRNGTMIDEAVLSIWGDAKSSRNVRRGHPTAVSSPAAAFGLAEEGDVTVMVPSSEDGYTGRSTSEDGVGVGVGVGVGIHGRGGGDGEQVPTSVTHLQQVKALMNCRM